MPIALFSDLLSIITIHIYSFYIASARIFNWQLSIIISLFHLFRGKKRNVLRNRIDSCDYDLDQLLLGTILFTVLFFLLPTVIVFYLAFASARMLIISLKAALDTWLAFLNHFPLFALMLRVKDPGRLPGMACTNQNLNLQKLTRFIGGIYFSLREEVIKPSPKQKDGEATRISYIHLEVCYILSFSYLNIPIPTIKQSMPLSLRAMFDQYFQLGHRLRKHYLSPSVILCLVTGRFVPPIHRRNLYSMQYSMLPAHRAGMFEVWSRLMEKSTSNSSAGGRGMNGGMGNGLVKVPANYISNGGGRRGHR